MNVCFNSTSHLEIDNQADILNIYTTTSKIRGHQYIRVAVSQGSKRCLSLFLIFAGMQRSRTPLGGNKISSSSIEKRFTHASPRKIFCDHVGSLLLIDKYDNWCGKPFVVENFQHAGPTVRIGRWAQRTIKSSLTSFSRLRERIPPSVLLCRLPFRLHRW